MMKLDKLFKRLIDQSPFQVTYFDLEFNLLYLNNFACMFNGLEVEQITGTSIHDFMVPEAKEQFLKTIESIDRENPVQTIENANIDKDGNRYWYLWIDRGVFNDDGELIGYQSIGQDITRKKEIENALDLSRKRLSEAQQIGNMGGWEWNILSKKTYWSDETYRILGLSPGEIEPSQENYLSFMLPEHTAKFLSQRKKLLKYHVEEINIEYQINKRSGKALWIRDRGMIKYENGTPAKITGTILDITESKELQLSLEEHIAVEETLLQISNTFMLAEKAKTGAAIKDTMRILGTQYGADRTYLVLEESEDGLYQWFSATGSKTERWQGAEADTPELLVHLKKKNGVSIPSIDDWTNKKDISWFKGNGIEAFICVTLYQNSEACGYLCLDNAVVKPQWSNIDFSILKIAGEMCVNARESIKTRNEIIREKELLSVTLMSIGDGFILLGPDGSLEMINNSATEMLGLPLGNLQGRYFEDVIRLKIADTDLPLTFAALSGQLKMEKKHREAECRHSDGSIRTLSYSCTAVPTMWIGGEGFALIFRDVTEEKAKHKEIAYLSFHNALTGLYNRAFMDTELRRLDTERQLPISIIMGDVNGLKLVNDVFGHTEGDKLLVTIADILKSCCRDEDVISRWGGDEFSIILPGTDLSSADRICERIKQKCEHPIDTKIIPSIALGSASKTNPEEDMTDVLREAEDRMYRQKLLDDRSVRSDVISSLKKSMFEKSYETEEHTQRMLKITERFGKSLKLPRNQQSDLNLLAIMHDMGKIAVPSRILGKTEKLTDDEWEEIKRHPEAGFRIAKSSQKLSGIADLILSHHERWDGKGYPRSIKEEEIPVLSRIISIIDTYDVMTNGRVYKRGVTPDAALEEIIRCSGSQFDPVFAGKFVHMMEKSLITT